MQEQNTQKNESKITDDPQQQRYTNQEMQQNSSLVNEQQKYETGKNSIRSEIGEEIGYKQDNIERCVMAKDIFMEEEIQESEKIEQGDQVRQDQTYKVNLGKYPPKPKPNKSHTNIYNRQDNQNTNVVSLFIDENAQCVPICQQNQQKIKEYISQRINQNQEKVENCANDTNEYRVSQSVMHQQQSEEISYIFSTVTHSRSNSRYREEQVKNKIEEQFNQSKENQTTPQNEQPAKIKKESQQICLSSKQFSFDQIQQKTTPNSKISLRKDKSETKKQEQTVQQKKVHKRKNQVQILNQVKRWKKMQAQLQKNKIAALKQQRKRQNEKRREKQEQEKDKKYKQIMIKRSLIQERIRKNQERRLSRQKRLSKSRQSLEKSYRKGKKSYRYLKKLEQDQKKKLEQQKERQQALGKRKKDMKIDLNDIKEHEKKFTAQIKQRSLEKQKSRSLQKGKEPISDGQSYLDEQFEVISSSQESQQSQEESSQEFNEKVGKNKNRKKKQVRKKQNLREKQQKHQKIREKQEQNQGQQKQLSSDQSDQSEELSDQSINQQQIKKNQQISSSQINAQNQSKEANKRRKSPKNKQKDIKEKGQNTKKQQLPKHQRIRSMLDLHNLNEKQKLVKNKQNKSKISSIIEIKTDEKSMKKALILKDKIANPLKYNYLRQSKGLSDETIFDQYKQFRLGVSDKKELGNKYLQEMKSLRKKIGLTDRNLDISSDTAQSIILGKLEISDISLLTNKKMLTEECLEKQVIRYKKPKKTCHSESAKVLKDINSFKKQMQKVKQSNRNQSKVSKTYLPSIKKSASSYKIISSKINKTFDMRTPKKIHSRNLSNKKLSNQKNIINASSMQEQQEINKIIHRYENKSQIMAQLTKKSSKYHWQLMKKTHQLGDTGDYGEWLGKESIIDDLFVKALRNKIATAQLQ